MRIVILFQGVSCPTHIQWVIVLSTNALIIMSISKAKKSYSYESCGVDYDIQRDLLS